jgi:DNA-binding transcriptional ArsR family regulator
MPDSNGHLSGAEMDLGAVLLALGDPNRRRVVAELAAHPDVPERACSSFGFSLARSTQSQLFNVLEDSGLVTCTDYGNYRGVALRREIIDGRFPGLLDLLAREVTTA